MAGHTKKNDDAVSPVIGTILMVALVVILAAVIGALVFGLAGNLQKTKIVAVTASSAADWITITYDGGQDASQVSNLSLFFDGTLVGETDATPAVGDSWPVTGVPAGPHHISVVGKFKDGSEQVVLDKNIYSGSSTSTTTTVTPTPTVVPPPICVEAAAHVGNKVIILTFNKSLSALPGGNAGFTVSGVSGPVIDTVQLWEVDNKYIFVNLTTPAPSSPDYTWGVTYTPGSITSTDGGVLGGFDHSIIWV